MPVKININKNAVAAKVMGAFEKTLPVISEEILNDCNQYVKWDMGMLAQSSYIQSDFKHGVLIWETPYARRQYWEIKTAYTGVNPGARWKWAHYAKSKHMAKWERQEQALMKKNL